jgi:hypothetical protein
MLSVLSVTVINFWLSCSDCNALVVLYRLSFPDFPVMAVLSCLLSWLSFTGRPILAILS